MTIQLVVCLTLVGSCHCTNTTIHERLTCLAPRSIVCEVRVLPALHPSCSTGLKHFPKLHAHGCSAMALNVWDMPSDDEHMPLEEEHSEIGQDGVLGSLGQDDERPELGVPGVPVSLALGVASSSVEVGGDVLEEEVSGAPVVHGSDSDDTLSRASANSLANRGQKRELDGAPSSGQEQDIEQDSKPCGEEKQEKGKEQEEKRVEEQKEEEGQEEGKSGGENKQAEEASEQKTEEVSQEQQDKERPEKRAKHRTKGTFAGRRPPTDPIKLEHFLNLEKIPEHAGAGQHQSAGFLGIHAGPRERALIH